MLRFDMLPAEANKFLQAVYQEMVDDLMKGNTHPFVKNLWHAIRYCSGETLGLKRVIFPKMTEASYESKFHLPSTLEMLRFDEPHHDFLFELTQDGADEILQELRAFFGDDLANIIIEAIASWPPGYANLLSTKILCTLFLLREGSSVFNPFEFPVFSDPKNVEEAYSTDYAAADFQTANARLRSKIEALLKLGRQVLLFLDTNSLLMKWLKTSLRDFLATLGFVAERSWMGGEIFLYFHRVAKFSILVHKPLCKCSDPRPFIKTADRMIRSVALGIMGRFSQTIRRIPLFDKHTVYGNPIHAALSFLTIKEKFGAHGLVASAFFKYFMCQPGTNALLENKLVRTPLDPDYVASLRARHNRDDEECDRPVTSDLNILARSIITAPKEKEVNRIYASLLDLFSTDKRGSTLEYKAIHKRFEILLKDHVTPGSELQLGIREKRAENPQNRGGNTLSGDGKSAINQERRDNDSFMECLIRNHAPQRHQTAGRPFWIRKAQTPMVHPSHGKLSVNGKCSFLSCFPVYDQMTKGGIETRCESKASSTIAKSKTHTEHVDVKKYPEYSLSTSNVEVENDEGTSVYILVKLHWTSKQVPVEGAKPKSNPSNTLVASTTHTTPTARANTTLAAAATPPPPPAPVLLPPPPPSGTFQFYKAKLIAYRDEFGHVNVPQRYKAENETVPFLGSYLHRIRQGKVKPAPEDLAQLRKMGVQVETVKKQTTQPLTFVEALEQLKTYKQKNQNARGVPQKYKDPVRPNISPLGRWFSNQRNLGFGAFGLEQVKQIQALGFGL